jgi:hypothetical protein
LLEISWPFLAVLLVFELLCFVSVFPIEEELSHIVAFACLNIFYFGSLILVPAFIGTCGFPFVLTYGAFSIISYGFTPLCRTKRQRPKL